MTTEPTKQTVTPSQNLNVPSNNQSLNASLDFLRGQPAGTDRDSFAQHKAQGRVEVDALDTQISNLDRAIQLEQQKLHESKATLEASYHARSRLMHLRNAMLHFVLELETREDD